MKKLLKNVIRNLYYVIDISAYEWNSSINSFYNRLKSFKIELFIYVSNKLNKK